MQTQQPTGIVTSINDPAKAGRIRCALAAVDGNTYPEWIEPVFPPGAVVMPEVGDEVELIMPDGEDLIEFAHEIKYRGKVHDAAHPVPTSFRTNYPKRRGYYTKGGHLLIFDDQDNTISIVNGKSSTQIDFDGSGNIILTVTQLLKLGGSTASESVMKGEIFNTAHKVMLELISTYIGLVGTALAAVAVDSHASSAMDGVTITALGNAGTTASGTATTGIAVFLAKATDWLSALVKTK